VFSVLGLVALFLIWGLFALLFGDGLDLVGLMIFLGVCVYVGLASISSVVNTLTMVVGVGVCCVWKV